MPFFRENKIRISNERYSKAKLSCRCPRTSTTNTRNFVQIMLRDGKEIDPKMSFFVCLSGDDFSLTCRGRRNTRRWGITRRKGGEKDSNMIRNDKPINRRKKRERLQWMDGRRSPVGHWHGVDEISDLIFGLFALWNSILFTFDNIPH